MPVCLYVRLFMSLKVSISMFLSVWPSLPEIALPSSDPCSILILLYSCCLSCLPFRSGLLRRHDQVLAVNGHVFETDVTRDQAVRILHQLTGRIELVVARGPPPPPPPPPPPTTDEGDRVPDGQGPGTGSDDDPDLERPTDSGLGSDGFDMVVGHFRLLNN